MYNYFLYLEIYKFNFFFKIITKFINGIFNWKNWRKKQANARFKMPQCTIIAISNQFSSQHRSIQSQIKRSVQQQQQKQQLRILFSTDIWENSSWDYSARSSWFLWLKPYLSCEVQTPCVTRPSSQVSCPPPSLHLCLTDMVSGWCARWVPFTHCDSSRNGHMILFCPISQEKSAEVRPSEGLRPTRGTQEGAASSPSRWVGSYVKNHQKRSRAHVLTK